MKKVTIIHPFDPQGTKVGGIETFTKGFIKYAPEDMEIELVGINASLPQSRTKRRYVYKLGKKKYNFYPLFYEKNENRKTLVPVSLRFATRLVAYRHISERILIFHRIEPILPFVKSGLSKIVFIHNDIERQLKRGSDSFWRYFPQIYFFLEKVLLSNVDYVYTVNLHTLNFYKTKYPHLSDKINFIPTWVDQGIFHTPNEPKEIIRRQITTASKIPLDHTWILFVGRLQEQKAPLRLIEVFYEYSKTNPKASLIIIGEGDLKEQSICRAEELGVRSAIHFLGFKRQRELARFYQASDVLLLTSNYEGMPICCLEALGSGLPVVSTKVGEVGRVIRRGFSGEIVEDFSPISIAHGIKRVAQNPDIYTKENCLASVANYTPQEVLGQTYELIHNL